MAASPHPLLPAEAGAQACTRAHRRQTDALWLSLQIIGPRPDAKMLGSLAQWAESLTPIVVLRPDEGLLLEVRGSLKFFSGLAAIRQQLIDELERRGHSYRLAVAPTSLAASWLARCQSIEVTGQGQLAGAVGRLPLEATGWPESVLRMLVEMGLRSIADCLRLPRSGFARRVGPDWLDELDRALGKVPDAHVVYYAPETLTRNVELSFETSDRSVFAEALGDMAQSLERELRRRQTQIEAVTLAFRHLRHDATATQVRFVAPVHERARILNPLLARMERIEMPAPANALSLTTSVLLPLRVDLPELLPALPGDPPGKFRDSGLDFALVESLRGRFGADCVYGISAVAEHRPEYAWRRWCDAPAADMTPEPSGSSPARPLWLLPRPRKSDRSLYSVPDSAGAERIESGWWDGQDVRRDYHVATGPVGEKLWLYRDCSSDQWYVHGIFG